MRRLALVASITILLLAPSLAYAQRTNASIRGTVRDATQGVLPGVTITATNEDTGLVRSVVTNESGVYSAADLPIGRYKVEAELPSFKKASRTGVVLRVADEFSIDFELAAGNVADTVNVVASATPVRVLGGDVSGVITGEQVRELPLNGRNFLQLATLMPGVSAPDFLNVKDKGLLGGSDLSVSGSDVTANLWSVDGANNNDVGSNRTILVYPSLEAIQEFKILRNNYGPEYGGAGGAQINIVTQGGTNRFSGSSFYSGRSDALNSTDYFLKVNNQPKASLKRNDFGGSIGGPLMRDKVHFFANAEWNLEDRGTARTGFVPTQAERNGDFSGPQIANCSSPIPVDPLTGSAVPREQNSGQSPQPRGTGLSQSVLAAQRDARRRKLQQLGDVGCLAHRLPSVQRPRGLEHEQYHAIDGALHAGQLEEQRARASRRTSGETISSLASTRTGTSRANRSWCRSTRRSVTRQPILSSSPTPRTRSTSRAAARTSL